MQNLTKAAIKTSFIKLLNERPLKQITVRDIADECGINRNSFYYHFADIPSLLQEITTDEAARIIAEHPSFASIEDCIMEVTHFAHENKRAILHIYNSVNRELYEQYLWQVSESVVTVYADTLLEQNPISPDDRRLVIQFYKCIVFGLSTEWVRKGLPESYIDDLHRICALKSGMAEEMIARCRAAETEEQ